MASRTKILLQETNVTPLDATKEGDALGALLLARKRMTVPQLDAARRESTMRGTRLGSLLLAQATVELDELAQLLAEIHGTEAATHDAFASIEDAVLQRIPARVATRALAVPLKARGGTLDVAFADIAAPGILEEISRIAAGLTVRPHAAPEPLVYAALQRHYGLTRIPKHLAPLVVAVNDGSLARRGGPVPSVPDEYVTTPMGGAVPHTPDEVTTDTLGIAGSDATLEEIFSGNPSDDALGRAQVLVARAKDENAVLAAVVGYCAVSFAAVAVFARRPGEFVAIGGAGELATVGDLSFDDATPTVLHAALAGDAGYEGTVPDTPANALLMEALGRDPHSVLLVALRQVPGHELILYADRGPASARMDPAIAQRVRGLARRAREALRSIDAPAD